MNLLDVFFPSFCIACYKCGSVLCKKCTERIEYISRVEVKKTKTHSDVDAVYCIFSYKNLGKKLIRKVKYGLVSKCLGDFFRNIPFPEQQKLENFIQAHNIVYLQPIPLHSARLKQRGFNQAEFIAREIQKQTNTKIVNCLRRVKETKTQAGLHTVSERHENMKNAFIPINSTLIDKPIALIDDLYTSGNTTTEAARVLRQITKSPIFVITLAHG